ncbi:TatD family hydrolase [Megasphaera massiliensis]|uniref:TatD family hydrolase n=1 Tax=Megasphaera massiliensis TaxID=1232428 RepID=UPI000423141F|nr:TatD family hydrolase [Megasphaera massiliensis]MBS6255382.1 TatD family hydrolase [Megasphaera sp.]
MDITYYDIGLNLFTRSFPDPEKIIADAEADGICCILTGSEDRENRLVDDFVRTHQVFGTAGIHPHVADAATEADVEEIRRIVTTNPKIVAVGETGLDYDRMFSKKENQLYFFKKLIALAEELDKPMFLHERDAGDDFLACFKGHEGVCPKSVVHCYTGDKETLARMLDMGFYIGITGWICDERRADALREAVSILPLDRVLLETDAPYLTPRGFHLPRTNVPNNITYVASTLAKYMDVSVEALTVQAKANTERLFRL